MPVSWIAQVQRWRPGHSHFPFSPTDLCLSVFPGLLVQERKWPCGIFTHWCPVILDTQWWQLSGWNLGNLFQGVSQPGHLHQGVWDRDMWATCSCMHNCICTCISQGRRSKAFISFSRRYMTSPKGWEPVVTILIIAVISKLYSVLRKCQICVKCVTQMISSNPCTSYFKLMYAAVTDNSKISVV